VETSPSLDPSLRAAARFWERCRLLYNAILAVIVLLWVVLTWPHFRPLITPLSLEFLTVFALLANLCYSTAYIGDRFMRVVVPVAHWPRFRQMLFVLGTLFAMLVENYWIADEIYPYVEQGPPNLFGGIPTMGSTAIASNMNFPAPLAVLGFLAAIGCLFLASASALIFWFARKPRFARVAAFSLAAVAVVYFALLLGFSAASHDSVLAHGQEKYFCEIDCHLAYSIVDAKPEPDGRLVITLRTRFDETTTSPNRPKDAPLTPSPREVRLVDSGGRQYAPTSTAGTPLLTPLKPADSYTTQLEFTLPKDSAPKDATALRLLINTAPQWPDKLVIGDENSLLHKKTYFAL
jgi:hypothetical protein